MITIALYMGVFVVAVSQARAMRSHVSAITAQYSMTVTVKKSELKAARTLGVVFFVAPQSQQQQTSRDVLQEIQPSVFKEEETGLLLLGESSLGT
ncbi:trace amine-associated receptor 13c-like protein [Lates japonicus]|uniref:Trace amine-associated receptor 13c-like protein n=1 Tax=Lates japonicus TaxID=270547 RepID=A0AAD3RHC0_LATJO|nr:trace amine-associated receptor 13c-like protein [Lates japonicus]